MSKPGICPECGGDSDGKCSSCHEYTWNEPLNTIHQQQLVAAKDEIERLTREREVYRKLAIREAMVGTLHWSREVAEKHVDDLAKEMEGRDE